MKSVNVNNTSERYLFLNNITGKKTKTSTYLTIKVTEDSFIFSFECEDYTIYNAYDTYNSAIYEGDVAEVFISPDGDLENYYEVEVSPNGTLFYAKVNNKNGKTQLTYLQNVIKTSSVLTDVGYSVMIELPFNTLKNLDFDKVVFNAYRIDSQGLNKSFELQALNPTLNGTFHTPDKFIRLKVDNK